MSALLLSLAALLLSSSVQAQFEGAVVSPSGIGPLSGRPPVPTGGADTRASSPQQIDFRAPAQFDFSENAAPPQTPPDPDERMRARRTPASVDRRADRPADEPVPGSLRALDAAKAENASSPSAAAPRRLTNRRVEDDDEDASALLRSPE